MYRKDIYFSNAVEHAFEILVQLYEVEPSLERLRDHPARDDLLLSGLETPHFSSIEPGHTINIRIWVRYIHDAVWNDNILNEVKHRVNRQSHGDGIEFIFEVKKCHT